MIDLTFEGFLDKFKNKKKVIENNDVLHFPTGEKYTNDLPEVGDYAIINHSYCANSIFRIKK